MLCMQKPVHLMYESWHVCLFSLLYYWLYPFQFQWVMIYYFQNKQCLLDSIGLRPTIRLGPSQKWPIQSGDYCMYLFLLIEIVENGQGFLHRAMNDRQPFKKISANSDIGKRVDHSPSKSGSIF